MFLVSVPDFEQGYPKDLEPGCLKDLERRYPKNLERGCPAGLITLAKNRQT